VKSEDTVNANNTINAKTRKVDLIIQK
jgi:hypothetical protein